MEGEKSNRGVKTQAKIMCLFLLLDREGRAEQPCMGRG